MTKLRWKDHHPIYLVWNAMKTRCNNPSRHSAARYCDRGISYCPRWESFANFSADMLPTWRAGLILDRIDNDGDYSPENCRWATPTESSRNRSSNVLTLEQAREIRELYTSRCYTQRQLARMFGTSLTNVNHTIHHRQWKEL